MDNEIYEKMVENLKNHPENRCPYFKIEDGKIHEYSIVSVYQLEGIFIWNLVDENGTHRMDYMEIEDLGKTVFFERKKAEAELERRRNE